MDKTEFLIIGTGIAGFQAAKTIRKELPESMITVISKNKNLNKYREKISDEVYNNFIDRDEWLNAIDWYLENNIELLTGVQVSRIDTDKNIVVLDNGDLFAFDKLLIATGSRIVLPIIDEELDSDSLIIKTAEDILQQNNAKFENYLIMGSGHSQIAEAIKLKALGKDVTILERTSRLLSPSLNDEFSAILAGELDELGIRVVFGKEYTLSKKDGVNVVTSGDIKIRADVLLLNKGIKSNIALVMDSEIDYDIGIKVNEFMQTNIDGIYAAGDCVDFDGTLIGSWESSRRQGIRAAQNMMGMKKRYRYPDQRNIIDLVNNKLFFFGKTSSNENSEIMQREDGTLLQLFFEKNNGYNNLVGIVMLGNIDNRDEYVDVIMANRRNK